MPIRQAFRREENVGPAIVEPIGARNMAERERVRTIIH
jgi:hypothetical protein